MTHSSYMKWGGGGGRGGGASDEALTMSVFEANGFWQYNLLSAVGLTQFVPPLKNPYYTLENDSQTFLHKKRLM